MSAEARPKRRFLPHAIIGALLLAAAMGAAWYLTSSHFHDYVRRRLVARLEAITGGRVELGRVEWNLGRLNLVAHDLTIRGLEPPTEAPYFHADRVVLDFQVLSLAGKKIGLRYFELDHPVLRLIVYADGSTNQPTPKAVEPGASSLQPLFALELDHARVRDGMVVVNDVRVPLDAGGDNLQAQLAYVPAAQRYDGSFSASGLRLAYGDYRPFDLAVSAQFSLAHNQVELKLVKLATGDSRVESSGRLDNFNHPRLTLKYRAHLDLGQMAEITRLVQVRGGVLEVNGSGSLAADDFATSGSAQVQRLEYRDPAIRLAGLDGGAQFKVERESLSIPHVFAHALGGSISGSAEIRHWAAALKPGARAGMVSPAANAVAHLRLTELSVGRIADAISTRNLPLDKLNPAGSASGSMELTFRGSPAHAHAAFQVEVAPAPATPQQLPVRATIKGAYAIDTLALQLDELDAGARSLSLAASGRVARANNLRFVLTAGNLGDLDALLVPLTGAHRLPEGLTGRGRFQGTLSGTLSAPQVAGQLALTNFTLPMPLTRISQQATPSHLARFDGFTAAVHYSRSQLAVSNARLLRGHESIAFTLEAALDEGGFSKNLPLTVRADVRNFQARDLEGLLGLNYDLTGSANATVQVKGSFNDPSGSGHIQIVNVSIDGRPYQSVTADLRFADQEAQASNIVIADNGARITGGGAYNLRTTAFRLNLHGANFNLAQFPELQFPRLAVGGIMDFDARGSGTTAAPVVNADLHVRDVALNRQRLGNMEVKAVTSGGVMQVSARSNFPAAEFAGEGTVTMRGEFPAELTLRMTRLDVDAPLHEYLKGRITGQSSLSGKITLSGPLRRPRLLTVKGGITEFHADMENVRFHNSGPLRFRLADQVLTLEEFRLAGEENTQMSASGTLSLTGAKPLDLRAEGNVHLKLLQVLNPDLHADGMVNFRIHASGTVQRPNLFGQATINGGSLNHINFPNGLSDIDGTLIFTQDRMQIRSLTASSGGGTLNFGGFVTYAGTPTFDLSARGTNIRLRYPQGISTMLDCDLRLSGTANSSTLSGTATVTRLGMTPQFDLALAIARARQAPEAPNPKSPFNNMRLAVHVVSTPELQVQASLARLTGDMDINIRGTGTRPILVGRVNITEGQITLNGTLFQLERGDISFSNPVRIEPVLDLEATTRVRDYDITLGLHGPLDRLGTTYRSDPPLPTSDIIALLAFGRTREEAVMATEANPSFTESASNAILGQALSSATSSRVQRLFGVSRIKISPEVAGNEAVDPNARVTIEQQVTKDFTVTYVTDIAHSAQQIIQIEYNYSRKFSILATRDQYGVLSFDVRIKRRKR